VAAGELMPLTAGASGSSYDGKARIYAFANPVVIAQQSDAIQRAVFEALQVQPSSRQRFTLSESSGWFEYLAVEELWDRKAPPALPEQADALKAAEAALAAIEQKCSGANKAWPDALRGVQLLPPVNMIRRAGLHAVARPDSSAWDHWLYRGEPQLLLDGGALTRAAVFGAQVEVRIGHKGQVIHVRSRWRPLSGERILADMTSLPETASNANSNGGGDRPASILNFLLEGDDVPQYYLAPYYFLTDGDDVTTVSASPWSLTADIGRTGQGESQVTLTALAQGGSGDYLYNWAVYSPIDIAEGIRELGPGRSDIVETEGGQARTSAIDLDNGLYVAMLNIKDRATGAFKHHRQTVFSSPFQASSDGPAVNMA
jgi:hypothetical protein